MPWPFWDPFQTEQWRKQDYAFVKSFVAYVKNQVGVNATAVPHRPRSKVALIQRCGGEKLLHGIETIDVLLALCEGNPLVTSAFPS